MRPRLKVRCESRWHWWLLIGPLEYVKKFATKEAADAANEESQDENEEDSLQEFSDDEAPGMEL